MNTLKDLLEQREAAQKTTKMLTEKIKKERRRESIKNKKIRQNSRKTGIDNKHYLALQTKHRELRQMYILHIRHNGTKQATFKKIAESLGVSQSVIIQQFNKIHRELKIKNFAELNNTAKQDDKQ